MGTSVRDKKEEVINDLITRALAEDIRSGDVTTNAIIDEDAQAEAVWKAKDEGVIAGLGIAEKVFKKLDPNLLWQPLVQDGETVKSGLKIVEMKGKTRAILTAERLALNFAQRMSGIATQTRRFVEAVAGLNARILDTRKTVPGLRLLDKQAVKIGGGSNHRLGLFDGALIKDNHIAAAGGIANAVKKVRSRHANLTIEVETTTLEQVDEALSAGANIIMLDNMSLARMRKAVKLIDNKVQTEASGNVDLTSVHAIATTGVDFISAGALTHSVAAFDISQLIIDQNKF